MQPAKQPPTSNGDANFNADVKEELNDMMDFNDIEIFKQNEKVDDGNIFDWDVLFAAFLCCFLLLSI